MFVIILVHKGIYTTLLLDRVFNSANIVLRNLNCVLNHRYLIGSLAILYKIYKCFTQALFLFDEVEMPWQ